MKRTSNILFLLLISFIVIYGCKKDEQLDYLIEGCTDVEAMNYSFNATSNDGSCVYSYDIAQGFWVIDPSCDDIDLSLLNLGTLSLDTILPDSIEVKGEEYNVLSIDIGSLGVSIIANIDLSGSLLVESQSINFSSFPFPVTVSGFGKIESLDSGYLNLTFSAEFSGFPLFNSSCSIQLYK